MFRWDDTSGLLYFRMMSRAGRSESPINIRHTRRDLRIARAENLDSLPGHEP